MLTTEPVATRVVPRESREHIWIREVVLYAIMNNCRSGCGTGPMIDWATLKTLALLLSTIDGVGDVADPCKIRVLIWYSNRTFQSGG